MTTTDAPVPVEQVDPNACDHSFAGWREHDDGRGGEQVCTRCGLGAMAWTLGLPDLP